MAGTPEGAKKATAKLLAKDPDHFHKIGANGGKAQVAYWKKKGFANNRALAAEAGRKGGIISRRSG